MGVRRFMLRVERMDPLEAAGGGGEPPGICARVRAAREAAGLSQREVAQRIGIAEKTYAFYERSREPKPARLREIVAAIGPTAADLDPDRVQDMLAELREELRRLRRDLGLGD